MNGVRFRRFLHSIRDSRPLLLLCSSLLAGCAIALFLPPDDALSAHGEAVGSLLTSFPCMMLTASVYGVGLLMSGLSLFGFGCCLFCLGMCTAAGTAFLLDVFGSVAAPIAAWLFLPRLLLLCFCTADLSRRPTPRVASYLLATLVLFLAQYFLAPLFLSPLILL